VKVSSLVDTFQSKSFWQKTEVSHRIGTSCSNSTGRQLFSFSPEG